MEPQAQTTQPAAPNGVTPENKAAPIDAAKEIKEANGGTTTPAVPEETVRRSSEEKISAARFAALAKKESRAHREREELKRERGALEAAKAEHEKVGQWLRVAKQHPLEALKALGLNDEDIFNARLANGKPSPELEIRSVRDEISQLREQQRIERERLEQETKQKTEAEAARALDNWRASVRSFIKDKPDAYELINIDEAYDLVSAVIEEEFNKTKKLLTNEEAANKVELFLESQHKKRAAAKKFQVKKEEPKPDAKSGAKQTVIAKPGGVSNDLTASAASLTSRAQSDEERTQRALAALSK